MKKALFVLAVVAMGTAAFAQGTINFQNRNIPKAAGDGTTYNVPLFIFGSSTVGAGTLPGGTKAALYKSDGAGGLTQLAITSLRTDTPANAAFFQTPVTDIDTGLPAGSTATFTIRAWDGASFKAGTQFGEWTFTSKPLGGAGSPPSTPPGPTGWGSETGSGFQLELVPEPSTIALGALGIGALLLRRRK
jgi:hypothetical protein